MRSPAAPGHGCVEARSTLRELPPRLASAVGRSADAACFCRRLRLFCAAIRSAVLPECAAGGRGACKFKHGQQPAAAWRRPRGGSCWCSCGRACRLLGASERRVLVRSGLECTVMPKALLHAAAVTVTAGSCSTSRASGWLNFSGISTPFTQRVREKVIYRKKIESPRLLGLCTRVQHDSSNAGHEECSWWASGTAAAGRAAHDSCRCQSDLFTIRTQCKLICMYVKRCIHAYMPPGLRCPEGSLIVLLWLACCGCH